MGLHLSFGVGPIRYSTSGRRRRPTKAQLEAKREVNQATLKAIVLIVAAALMLVWVALLFVAWLVWLPFAGITTAVRRDGKFFKQHWHHPLNLGPWHRKKLPAG